MADFAGEVESQRALDGSPWMIGRYAIVSQDYNDRLNPQMCALVE